MDGNADRRQAVLLLWLHADVVGELAVERREREVRQRVPEAPLDLGAHPLGPEVVDHELHARLDARDAVAEVLAPRVEERAQHRDRLVRPDEDAEVACDAGHGREAPADEHAEPGLAVAEDADERDAVDLRREAAVDAGADRDLVLAGQVDVVRMPGEERVCLLDDGSRVEELVVRDAGDGAAGDRADGVAAAAEARQPGRVELLEDVGELGEAKVVELHVLARRQLRLALAVVDRELPDRSQLRRREASRGELDAEHEGADLRLVVVEAPPLEPDDVLLGDVGVARCDECGELVEHPERALLALQPLDAVPLEDELQRGRLGGRSAAGSRACHPLAPLGRRLGRPGGFNGCDRRSGGRVAVAIYPLAAPGGGLRLDVAPGGPEPRLRRCRRARSLDRSRWLTLQYV